MRLAAKSLVLALIGLLAATPTAVEAGKKNPNAIAITITMDDPNFHPCFGGGWVVYSGSFRVSGALSDRGAASAYHYFVDDDELIALEGKQGSLTVLVKNIEILSARSRGKNGRKGTAYTLAGAFEIVDGTGAYASLVATGTAAGQTKEPYDWWLLDCSESPRLWEQTWNLDGLIGG
jgi:hypothetical protein